MCTAGAPRVHLSTCNALPGSAAGMRSRSIGAVVLVILLGLVVGALGLVAADLYAIGVLILFVGGVGAAVLAGDYLIRYLSDRRPPV
jgi:hypothetical protein